MASNPDLAGWEGAASDDKQSGWLYPFDPHPKQKLASEYDVDELLFGGAAGPGKGHPLDVANVTYNGGMGAPQDQDVKVLTPFGFKLFRDVKVGDQLTNPDGSVQRVIQVFELGERDIYRVTFSDGATTLVTDDHLWLVNYSGKRYKAERRYPTDEGWGGRTTGRVETTAALRTHLDYCHAQVEKGKRPTWPLIPLTEPVPFTTTARNPKALRPVSPYLLGVLLGDGALSSGIPRFYSADEELAGYVREDGATLRFYQEPRKEGVQGAYVVDGPEIRAGLAHLDVLNGAAHKFIPTAYLHASVEDRWRLAQGLFDTDGTASTGGDVTFTTISPDLARDVAWLVRSLGFRANTTTKIPTYTHKGEKKQGQLAYTLHVQGDRTPDLFRLERKRSRCRTGMNGGQRVKRRMVSIEHVGRGEARCIKVDHPNSLYICDDFIVTHNTDWALAEAVNTCLAVPNAKVLLLRNTFGELNDEIIPRLVARIPPWVGRVRGNNFLFYNGARIRLGYLERDDNKRRYIGAEYVMIVYDELTLMPWSAYEFLRSRVRATGQVARDLKKAGLRPRIIATSNPGGAYHAQVKEHFVDAAPPGQIVVDPKSKLSRVYVPATIDDNPSMPRNYRQMLQSLPPEKRKALLEGSWDVLEGVRFSQWSRNIHVIAPEDLPLPDLSGSRVIGVDYGFADPFAAVWLLKLSDDLVLVYREAVATELTASQQARVIAENTSQQEWDAGVTVVADPSMWRRDNALGMKLGADAPPVGSPAYEYQKVLGLTPRKAINNRKHGAAVLDEKLRVREDGWPRILVYNTCINLIRTLPMLQRSTKDPDDVSTAPKQDDHVYDALRYGLMALEPRDPVVRRGRMHHMAPGGRFVTAGLMTKKF